MMKEAKHAPYRNPPCWDNGAKVRPVPVGGMRKPVSGGRASPRLASSRAWGVSIPREPPPASPALPVAVLAVILVVTLIAILVRPAAAFADDDKTALPTIQKSVSLDGVTYSGAVSTKAGSAVKYRLVMTMPECVADLKELVYTAHDRPNEHIDVDVSSVKARIVDADGIAKVSLSPKASKSGKRLSVALGDLKEACPSLEFGDCVVVDYDAHVKDSTPAGTYPNFAKLVYEMDGDRGQTVEVEAKVKVPAADEPDTDKAKTMPKTGDELSAMGFAGLAIASGAVLALAYARMRRE